MKKLILFFSALVLILTPGVFNQTKAQSICPWAKNVGGKNEDYGKAVATDAFGNVYYLGNFYSQTIVFGSTTLYNQAYAASNYGSEMFLVKYDSCGNLQWAKQAGGNNDAIGKDIITDAAGNVYVAGYFNCDTVNFGSLQLIDSAYYDAFVVKYDASGNALWAVQGKGGDQDQANSLTLDAFNNVYITGSSASSAIKFGNDSAINQYGSGNKSVFIAKINNNGIIQWVRSGGGNSDAIGYGIGTDPAGNVYVGGTFESSFIRFGNDSVALVGYYDIFVVKYNAGGTVKWLKTAGDVDDDEARGLATDAHGNVYITGFIGSSSTVTFGIHSITSNNEYSTMFLAKYDTSGTAQWASGSHGDNYSYTKGYDVAIDAKGTPNIIGFYSSDSLKMGAVTLYNNSLLGGGGDTLYDIFAAKYNGNGSLSWARTAGGAGNDFGYGIATGHRNGLYITGEFASPSISFAAITLTLTPSSIAGDGDAFIADNIATSPNTQDICLVTVDSLSQHNIIVWQKPATTGIDSFIVYREIATNNYQPIGAVAYGDLSMFVDTVQAKYFPNTGNPNSGTYRYKLALRDTSGNYSLLSPYHNTIFIQNNNGNFSWQQLYTIEGSPNPVTNYILMRDDQSTGNFHQVESVAGTQQNVSDPQYASYPNGSWFVETQWNISCTPTRSATRTSSSSNIIGLRIGAGIEMFDNLANAVLVFPNPSNGVFSIKSGTNISTIQVTNTMGQTVLSQQVAGNATVDLSKEAKGVYFYKVSDNKGNTVGIGKMIVE